MNKLEKTYKNKKVLITGHTGFKGSWLSSWLSHLGASVIGVSNGLPSSPNNFNVSNIKKHTKNINLDIRDLKKLKKIIQIQKPDFIFHLAAQSLVRPSYLDPIKTFTTNAIGTANLLESIKEIDKKLIVVMITSDKVYENLEWEWGYREIDLLRGKDPYSASKSMAEHVIYSFFNSYFKNTNKYIKIGIARAGNVIGGGDWAADRIVPDCIRSWSNNKKVTIRSPNSTRPWQHVLEPLSGYLCLGLSLLKNNKINGESYNFGPHSNQNHTVMSLIREMSSHWKGPGWEINKKTLDKKFSEAGLLKLNCEKAASQLGWYPNLSFQETVKFTTEWYKNYYSAPKNSMLNFSISQIDCYTKLANKKKIDWSI